MAVSIVMDHVKYTGNVMLPAQNGTGFMMPSAGGVVPPSLLQESRIPRFYKEAIAKCGAVNVSQLPNTALVYNLMVTSRLPRTVLGNIWSLVNRTLPGQLTRQEFFSCLALIALIQKGQPLSALSTMSSLPIPHLQACAPFAQYLPAAGAGDSQQSGYSPQTMQGTSSTTGMRAVLGHQQPSASTSDTMSLLSDINFSIPLSSSNTQLTTAVASPIVSAAQNSGFSGSQSQLPIGDNTGISQFVTAATPKPFNLTANSSNLNLISDIQPPTSRNPTAVSLTEFPKIPKIPATTAATLRPVSQIPDSFFPATAAPASGSNNLPNSVATTNPTTRILEPLRNSDPYSAIKLLSDEDKFKEEECLRVWQRCINEAHKLIVDADTLLPCSATANIAEIVRTDRGARYLKALYEIHEVTMRIRKGRMDKLIMQREILEKIDQIWARFEGFMDKNDENDDLKEESETAAAGTPPSATVPALCGICLTNISSNSLLEFTGTSYHKQCANLWINRIDSLLPKLNS